jgi:hypothetical protein
MAGTKTRTLDNPYAIFVAGSWEWRVLKRYQTSENEKKNLNAVWFCAVRSPMTYGSWDYGDTYIRDIPGAYAGYAFPEDGAVRKDSGTTITTATLYPSR